jgi:hypothetical protein
MTTAALSKVSDSLILPVPADWLMVDGDVTEGLLWWLLVDTCCTLRRGGTFNAASPLNDVKVHVCRDVDDVQNLRAELGSALADEDKVSKLVEAAASTLTRSKPLPAVAVCTFSYDALTSITETT